MGRNNRPYSVLDNPLGMQAPSVPVIQRAESVPQTCGTCVFWRQLPDYLVVMRTAVAQGKCHRYPQTTAKPADDFCGEFKLDSKSVSSDRPLQGQK